MFTLGSLFTMKMKNGLANNVLDTSASIGTLPHVLTLFMISQTVFLPFSDIYCFFSKLDHTFTEKTPWVYVLSIPVLVCLGSPLICTTQPPGTADLSETVEARGMFDQYSA